MARVGIELLRALIDEIDETAPELRLKIATSPDAPLPDAKYQKRWISSRAFSGRLGEQLGLPLAYPGAVVLSFCNTTPIFARRSVLWIHDAQVFDAPETYTQLYRMWHRTIVGGARLRQFSIVTVSDFARGRLIHHGLDPRRVRVVHNGGDHILREPPDTSAMVAAGLEEQRFILVVGSPARHKNVPFAVQALLAHGDPSLRIAVVGLAQQGPYRDAGVLPTHPRLVVLPRIDDAQLRALYAAARVVVAPSLFEGFGLYVAEAMFADSGSLVLSNRSALPEVGGDAALYFDPTDPLALSAAVSEALKPDTAARLRRAARLQREKFRWRRAARAVLDGYLRPPSEKKCSSTP